MVTYNVEENVYIIYKPNTYSPCHTAFTFHYIRCLINRCIQHALQSQRQTIARAQHTTHYLQQ